MSSKTKYWTGLDQLDQNPATENQNEFPEALPVDKFLSETELNSSTTGRRDFLKFLGFSVAAATLAACEAPVIKSVPYVNKPEDVTPGVANWYASAYYDGNSFANVLIKTREARPIHVKGNRDHGITNGAVNPRIVASVLSLYDSERLQGPTINGEIRDWNVADDEIKTQLETIAKDGGNIRILSRSIISPSTEAVINDFKSRYTAGSVEVTAPVEPVENVIAAAGAVVAADTLTTPEVVEDVPAAMLSPVPSVGNANFKHVQYDAVSYSALKDANKECFGKAVIPDYDFSKAKTIVSISADFLGTWLSSTEYIGQYTQNRKPDEVKFNNEDGSRFMSKHYHFESIMSMSGSNADYRSPIKPSQEGKVAAAILKALGGSTSVDTSGLEAVQANIDKCVADLKASKGESLVVSGSNSIGVQILVNAINEKLGNYASTINLNNALLTNKANDAEVKILVDEVIAGKVDALLIYGCNPVYTLPNGEEFKAALENMKLSVSFSSYADETAVACKYVCPDHHYMEAWNDYKVKDNHYALAQPVIRPLFDTASWQESLLVWANPSTNRGGKNSTVYHDYLKGLWMQFGYPMAKDNYTDETDYWNYMVHNGSSTMPAKPASAISMNSGALAKANSGISTAEGEGMEVVFYQKSSMGIGQQAGNPWLQEMPDPITKVTWDNYVTMNPNDAKAQDFNTTYRQNLDASMATVIVNGVEVKLPVYAQPGQARGTIGIALGYGRGGDSKVKIGKAAYQRQYTDNFIEERGPVRETIGANAFSLASFVGGYLTMSGMATVKGAGEEYPLALTQIQGTSMGRFSVVREATLDKYLNGQKETDYTKIGTDESAMGFNPTHTLPVHEDVAGLKDESGRFVYDEDGNLMPDGHVDANDRKHVGEFDLWAKHPVDNVGHRWGMAIDLNACFGCGSCLISCQSENNVPVVGKDEVYRARDMHWLRIDRYYTSEVEELIGQEEKGKTFSQSEGENIEVAEADNPKVVYMPMMCHHCNHAPCETVCPVAATTHSNEGLNQMTYNRCIGTRYCGNNCPYKVRRFNWFNYPSYNKFQEINPAQDDLGRMVLNPDVTVRTRGVMEKCSMCVQRIQEGKLEAKKNQEPVKDGAISTACADACPVDAITFGDLNDKKETYQVPQKDANGDYVKVDGQIQYVDAAPRKGSKIYNETHGKQADRAYIALEEVGVQPNVYYQMKVRNIELEVKKTESKTEADH